MTRLAALPLVVALAACGPPSPERAYQICTDRARAAAGPSGLVGVGVGSGGPTARVQLEISTDYLAGRDPAAVYDSCYRNLTGAGPTRPLIL